jgi:hypothetical protein
VAQEAAVNALPYGQFLLLLAEQELAQRDENRQKRRIAAARFPVLLGSPSSRPSISTTSRSCPSSTGP